VDPIMSERFAPDVAAALTAAGWTPGRAVDEQPAVDYVHGEIGRDGARTEAHDAALAALREFTGLTVMQDGPGVELRRRPFVIDPVPVAASTETLADFGAVLGDRLFPIGMEGDHDSIIAMASSGHVFALDHAGEWHLGDSMDEALAMLVTGTQPPRVDDNGRW
jgi:hypothetical protein